MGDTIFIRGEGGTVFELGLPLHETIEDKLRKGYVTRCDADGEPYDGPDDDVAGLPDAEPSKNANKAEWVGWAVAQGSSVDDAEALTKADLIDKYGSN